MVITQMKRLSLIPTANLALLSPFAFAQTVIPQSQLICLTSLQQLSYF